MKIAEDRVHLKKGRKIARGTRAAGAVVLRCIDRGRGQRTRKRGAVAGRRRAAALSVGGHAGPREGRKRPGGAGAVVHRRTGWGGQ